MDTINKDSSFSSGVTFGECNVRHLLFAHDFALLGSKKIVLQYALDRFSDACLDAGMKINTTKTEIMCLSRHPVQCFFQENGVIIKQMEKFKYLGVTFSNDARQDNKLDTRIGKASAVMRQLYQLVVLIRELFTNAKLSVFKSFFVPILTYGHEFWAVTKRVKSRVQTAEMGFLQKVRVLSLLEKVKCTDIRQSFNIEPHTYIRNCAGMVM